MLGFEDEGRSSFSAFRAVIPIDWACRIRRQRRPGGSGWHRQRAAKGSSLARLLCTPSARVPNEPKRESQHPQKFNDTLV